MDTVDSIYRLSNLQKEIKNDEANTKKKKKKGKCLLL